MKIATTCCAAIMIAIATWASPSVPAVTDVAATKMGVDFSGNLWSWNAAAGTVTRIQPNGTRTVSRPFSAHAISVDADTIMGIAVLTRDAVAILGWDGTAGPEWRLSNEATDIAWISADEVAVTPRFSGHRVEIWNVRRAQLGRTIGPCAPVPDGPGLRITRPTLIRYDQNHKEIVTLDAYRGEVIVFSRGGDAVRRAGVVPPNIEKVRASIAEADRNAKEHQQTLVRTILNYPTVTVSNDGTVLFGDKIEGGSNVSIISISRAGDLKRTTIAGQECASLHVQAWQDYLIFFREPNGFQPSCAGVRRSV